MITFEAQLSDGVWTEIADGADFLAFDVLVDGGCEVYMTESAATPLVSAQGNAVKSWPASWDFLAQNIEPGKQRVWARGNCIIRGIRG